MRMNPTPRQIRIMAWLCALVALCTLLAQPAAAAAPALTEVMTHQVSALWIPATAYGCTLLAAFNRFKK